ncbi:unnamed protein product [Arctia plantaginis]|uniref:FP protein C-terminal domain-containing protein n=1 Tax=Arctia plantaginis TaxID=874455 RepID=A0A8S1A7Q1_ARCPL|nr:unnamed protein product [Arctia plantaginis]
MASHLNKSVSDTDVNRVGSGNKTPPSYVFQRVKRSRENTEDCLIEQLNEFKEEMKKMMSLFTANQSTEMIKITTTLKEIQYSNSSIENSIAFLTAQNEEYKQKIIQLENQAKEDKKYIVILENKMEEMLIGSRKANFVIQNVPKRNNETKEDLIEMTLFLSQTIGCNINKHDIKDIYRVRGRNLELKKSPIVVETGSTLLKTEIMKTAKAFNIKHKAKLCCKHLGFKTQVDDPIFLSEHLTAKGSRLHFLARDLVKSGSHKYCWTSYGNVYVMKDDQAPTITIRNEEQVHKLTLAK